MEAHSCEAHGVSLGGAASSADLGCSSEYSTDVSLKAEVGKGFVSTAIGHESLGTKANVRPHLWKGVIARPAARQGAAHPVG